MNTHSSKSPRLSATAISFSLGHKQLVSKVSLSLHAGELVGVVGPNGAGKSTLLAMLAGLLTPSGGEVSLDGQPLAALAARERAQQLGWLEQWQSVHWALSVERLVALGRLPHLDWRQQPGAQDQRAIEHALRQTDCIDFRDQDVTTLSGGERSRALLARVMAGEPDIVLADEPITALDLGHQLQTMECLRQFAREHRAAIVVLHDLSLAARYCDRLYLLDRGDCVAEGSVASVLSPDRLRSVYGVEVIAGCEAVPWIIPVKRVQDP